MRVGKGGFGAGMILGDLWYVLFVETDFTFANPISFRMWRELNGSYGGYVVRF